MSKKMLTTLHQIIADDRTKTYLSTYATTGSNRAQLFMCGTSLGVETEAVERMLKRSEIRDVETLERMLASDKARIALMKNAYFILSMDSTGNYSVSTNLRTLGGGNCGSSTSVPSSTPRTYEAAPRPLAVISAANLTFDLLAARSVSTLPIPELFYDAARWHEFLIADSTSTTRLSRSTMEMPITVMTAAVSNVICIYGNFRKDVLSLLSQVINPLFAKNEYEEKVYQTLKKGAVAEKKPSINKLADSLLFLRNLFEKDQAMLSKYFTREISEMSGLGSIDKFDRFSSILYEMVFDHLSYIIELIKVNSPRALPSRIPGELLQKFYFEHYFSIGSSKYGEESIHFINIALTYNPTSVEAYGIRGMANYALGNTREAVIDLEKCGLKKAEYAEVFNKQGNTLFGIGDFLGAVGFYSKAIDYDPLKSIYYDNRSFTNFIVGHYDEALVDCDTAIRINPACIGCYTLRGRLKKEKGLYAEALIDLASAIKIDEKMPNAYRHCGDIYRYQGDLERAIQNYDKAIGLNADYIQAIGGKGIALYQLGLTLPTQKLELFMQAHDYLERSNVTSAEWRKSGVDPVQAEITLTLRLLSEAILAEEKTRCAQEGAMPDQITRSNPIPEDTPPEFAAVIQDCWKLDPSERPHARDLMPRIDALAAGFFGGGAGAGAGAGGGEASAAGPMYGLRPNYY